MDFDKEMEAALIADGEKLRALTGEDHGPWDLVAPECPKCGAASGDDWSQCEPHHPCPMGGHGAPLPDADVGEPRYLIIKRGLYECPNHQGYTGIRDQAGRYSLAEAKDMFRRSDGECRWIHEDQAKEFMPAAWNDLVIKHVLGQRDALTAEVAELREQLATLEALRPHWAQGFTSDGVAAQVQTAALAGIWAALGVTNQTDCMERLRSLVHP